MWLIATLFFLEIKLNKKRDEGLLEEEELEFVTKRYAENKEKALKTQQKIKKVVGCVLSHRTSKNCTNIEELCVADADILAHLDNMNMIINFFINYPSKQHISLKI